MLYCQIRHRFHVVNLKKASEDLYWTITDIRIPNVRACVRYWTGIAVVEVLHLENIDTEYALKL
jgi:hypothetical protein